jgi:hypothetical protein
MSPSSLLNVSSDLLRAHALHGMPVGPMASESDRRWTLGVCLALAALATLLAAALY